MWKIRSLCDKAEKKNKQKKQKKQKNTAYDIWGLNSDLENVHTYAKHEFSVLINLY